MPWRRQSYEVLPALSVRGRALRESLRTVTRAWMLGVVWRSCISGSQMKVFARMLGFDDFDFGLLAALPFVATFGQLVAAVLIEQTGLRKFQFLHCGTITRLLWLVVAAIPLALPVPGRSGIVTTLLVLLTIWFAGAMTDIAWLTWMGDLVPRRIRGRYFAARLRWTQPVGIVVVIALGILLDAVSRGGAPETAQEQPLLMYTICGIFAVGALFGTADILLFRSIRDVVRTTPEARPKPVFKITAPRPARWHPASVAAYAAGLAGSAVYQMLIEPLKDHLVRRYVLHGMTIAFVMSVGGWFFWLNAMENLGFSKLGVNFLFLVLSPVVGIFAAKVWGRLIDRWGRRPILIICTLGTITSILPWFLVTRDTPHPQFLQDAANRLAHALGAVVGRPGWVWVTEQTPVGAYLGGVVAMVAGGCFWTGVTLAQTGILLGFSDGQGRSKYVAASGVLISFGGIAGGIAGGSVAQALHFLQADPIRIGPFLWNNWHAAFALSAVGRILAVGWLIGMPDPGAVHVRYVLRQMGTNVYNAMTTRLFYPLRIFGWQREKGPKRNDAGDGNGQQSG